MLVATVLSPYSTTKYSITFGWKQGCIPPLCNLLTIMDNKTIQVALDAIDNILKIGEQDRIAAGPGAPNQYAYYVDEAGGMITIHNLQTHDNMEIYGKAFYILENVSSANLLTY